MKKSEIFFGVLKVTFDFVATIIAFLIAYKLRLQTEPIPGFAKPIDFSILPTIKEYFHFSIYVALGLIIVFGIGKMYTLKVSYKFTKELQKIVGLSVVWIALIIMYFFAAREFPFSRLAMLYSWLLTILVIFAGRITIRIIQKITLKHGVGKRKIVIIGKGQIAKEIENSLTRDKTFEIVDVMEYTEETANKLENLLEKKHFDEIIQTQSKKDILEFCNYNHVEYSFVPGIFEVQRTNIEIETMGALPIITLKKTPLDGWGKFAKRIMDLIGATTGVIILSPIYLITAIAIKLDSRGPILFTKKDDGTPMKRVGQYGELFKCYKFRSMHPNTHNLRYSKALLEKNVRKEGPLVKIQNDPRVTRVGKFIRKYSIDELPQLWNVIIGNMSLVGPRPHLPEEVAKYEKSQKFVLNIKPGLTGLPQTSGRSDLDFTTEARLDRYYIENWSIWLDIKLIFKTIAILLKGYKE